MRRHRTEEQRAQVRLAIAEKVVQLHRAGMGVTKIYERLVQEGHDATTTDVWRVCVDNGLVKMPTSMLAKDAGEQRRRRDSYRINCDRRALANERRRVEEMEIRFEDDPRAVRTEAVYRGPLHPDIGWHGVGVSSVYQGPRSMGRS